MQRLLDKISKLLGFKTSTQLNIHKLFWIVFGIGTIFTLLIMAVAPTHQRPVRGTIVNDGIDSRLVQLGRASADKTKDVQTVSENADQSASKDLDEYPKGSYLTSDQPYSDINYLSQININFLYFRATVGATSQDSSFMTSAKRAKDAQMPYGAVIQYDEYATAASQFSFFNSNNGGKKNIGSLPIVVDVQSLDDPTTPSQVANLVASLKKEYPKQGVIIRADKTNAELIKTTVTDSDVKFWLVANNADDRSDNRNEFIQYTMSTKVGSGIRQIEMNMSIYNGSNKDFNQMTKTKK